MATKIEHGYTLKHKTKMNCILFQNTPIWSVLIPSYCNIGTYTKPSVKLLHICNDGVRMATGVTVFILKGSMLWFYLAKSMADENCKP